MSAAVGRCSAAGVPALPPLTPTVQRGKLPPPGYGRAIEGEHRSKMTLCARRFGVAVRLASTHERDCEEGTASAAGVAHQSARRRARSGCAKPRRASICEKVRTTVSAKRLSRYKYSDRYSQTDDGDGGAVIIASQECWGS